jgi:hypothetical protein
VYFLIKREAKLREITKKSNKNKNEAKDFLNEIKNRIISKFLFFFGVHDDIHQNKKGIKR